VEAEAVFPGLKIETWGTQIILGEVAVFGDVMGGVS
jgi:hypothetical protein